MNVLIVVCPQKDILNNRRNREEIISNIRSKVEQYQSDRRSNIVYVIKDIHDDKYIATKENNRLPIHCLKDTDGVEIVEELQGLFSQQNIYTQNTPACTQLAYKIKNMNIVSKVDINVEIIGGYFDVQIISNAMLLRTLLPEVTITLDTDCCVGSIEKYSVFCIEAMRSCMIDVIGEGVWFKQ